MIKTKTIPYEISEKDAAEYVKRFYEPQLMIGYRGYPPEEQMVKRLAVGKLWLEGCSAEETGEKLGLSRSTVYRHRNWIMAQWLKNAMTDATEIVARIVQTLEHMNKELFAQWHRSKRAKRRRKYKKDEDGKSVEITVEGRLGDPQYLEQVRKNLLVMIGLLGLDDESNRQSAIGILDAMMKAAENSKNEYQQRLPESTVDEELEDYQ